jgi:hypothetical protein
MKPFKWIIILGSVFILLNLLVFFVIPIKGAATDFYNTLERYNEPAKFLEHYSVEKIHDTLVRGYPEGEWSSGEMGKGVYIRKCIIENHRDVPIFVWVEMIIGCNNEDTNYTGLVRSRPIDNPIIVDPKGDYLFTENKVVENSCSFTCKLKYTTPVYYTLFERLIKKPVWEYDTLN